METAWIDHDICILCGTCIPVCPRRVIEEGDVAAKIVDPARCMLCGQCKAVCPVDAPQLPSLSAEEFEPVPAKEDLPRSNQLWSLYRSRRSTRIYKNEPVKRELIEKILEAARFAPSGGNRQPLRWAVIHTTHSVERIRAMTIDALVKEAGKNEGVIRKKRESGQDLAPDDQIRELYAGLWQELKQFNEKGIDKLFYHAPSLIICHVDPQTTMTAQVDAGIAAAQMILMAETLGLGTCFCDFLCAAMGSSPELRKAIQIPDHHIVPLSFMLGYPDISYLRMVSRKPAQVNWF